MLVICPYIWELRNQNRRLTRLSFLTCSSRILLVLCSRIISISRFKATSELIAIPSSNIVSSMFMTIAHPLIFVPAGEEHQGLHFVGLLALFFLVVLLDCFLLVR